MSVIASDLDKKIGMLFQMMESTKSINESKEFIPENLIANNIKDQEYIIDVAERILARFEKLAKTDKDQKIIASFKLKLDAAKKHLDNVRQQNEIAAMRHFQTEKY